MHIAYASRRRTQRNQYKSKDKNGRKVREARGPNLAKIQGWRTRMADDKLKKLGIIDESSPLGVRPCLLIGLKIMRAPYSVRRPGSGSKVDHPRAQVDPVPTPQCHP